MKCTRVIDSMSEYLDGNLAGAESAEFELHVSKCPTCAQELREMRNMLEMMGALSAQQSLVDCWGTVHGRIAATHKDSRWRRWIFRPVMAAPAFAAAALVGVVLLWPGSVQDVNDQSAISMPEYSHYLTAHSKVQRKEAFADPDVTFLSAELERANLTAVSIKR